MATIGEAVMAAIAGGPVRDVATVSGGVQAWISEYGSLRAAARQMGVAPSTLRGWRDGRTPRGGIGSWLIESGRAIKRAAQLDPAREARMRQDWSLDRLKVTATYHYASGGTMRHGRSDERVLDLGPYMADVGEQLVDAYLDGASADELGDIFVGGIGDNGWYAQTFREEGDGAWDILTWEGWGG